MNVIDCFTKSISYIEDHLLDNITVDDVSGHVYLSSSYFQKLFMVLANMTISEYMRNRRLSIAGQELLSNKDVLVTDLAFKYGYENVESFTRAFKAFHGVLPSQVKKLKCHLSYLPKIEIVIEIKGGKKMNYEIVLDQEYTIIVYTKEIPVEENTTLCPKVWDEYYEHGYQKEVPPMLGVCLKSELPNHFIYGVGSTKECVKNIPEGFKEIKVPKQTYAKFTAKGVMPKAMQQLWKEILTEWLPNSNYELVDAPEFEYYTENDIHSSDYEFAIWLPVKLKQ